MEATVSFCFFLILFSQTFFSFLLSLFLWPSIPNLTSLFSLSITKSKTLVLLSLLDSPFTSCHLILPNCCFTFYFANTFFSSWSLIYIVALFCSAHTYIIGIVSNINFCVWRPFMNKLLLVLLLIIIYFTPSDPVELKNILRFFPFSSFSVNASSLHVLIFFLDAASSFILNLAECFLT